MGIRHLYTFISNMVPHGTYTINLPNEIEKFKRENPNVIPVIVIDLLTLVNKVFESNHEILIGGRYNIYNERAYQIFSALKSLEVELIFFCDGPVQPDKLTTCLQRRNDHYADHIKILNEIDNGLDLSGNLNEYRVQNLTQFCQNFIDIAEEFGKVHVSTLNECDQEIAFTANQSNAIAIISQDTDFLIFEGKWRYWSANDLNFQTMTTLEFNKYALREVLALTSRQMVLFGTLGGNDILLYEMVQDYHNRIASRRGKFYQIANEVRRMHSLPPNLSHRDENYLYQYAFEPQNRSQCLRNLRASLNLYCYVGMQNSHTDPILEIVSKDPKRFNFVILNNQVYILNLVYFDLSKNYFMPFYDLVRPLLRRIMGILLQHKKQNLKESEEPPKSRLYCKFAHERPYELIIEMPEYPPCQIPPILKFLYQSYGQDEEMDNLRLDLFCWQISEKLNRQLILQLPKDNLITIMTIFYLHERDQISTEEGDCLLLASNCSTEIRDSLKLEEMKTINGRDARLAFLFPRIFNMIYNCCAAVGLKQFRALITFDGLVFHWLRKKCEKSVHYFKSSIEKYQHLRIYSQNDLVYVLKGHPKY